jgi:hypothetical protein
MSALPPRYHLRHHWRVNRQLFWQFWFRAFERQENTRDQLLLTLGAIRCLYWQALGQGHDKTARTIANWWSKVAPLHQQGALIQ